MNMDAVARKWLFKQAHKHHWRVCSWYDLDDLIQDGYMCWVKVTRYYPCVKDRPHMMRLFQRTFLNHVHNLAKLRSRQPDICINQLLIGEMTEQQFLDAHDPGSPTILETASTTVLALARIADEHPQKLDTPLRRRKDGTRETTNERLCWLLGLDHCANDMAEEVKCCLSE